MEKQYDLARRLHDGWSIVLHAVCVLGPSRIFCAVIAVIWHWRCGVCRCRQVALLLIQERSRLVSKLLETRQHGSELERQLSEERERARAVSAELDRRVAECEQLCSRLSCAESLNRSLQAELNQVQMSAAPNSMAVGGPPNRPLQAPVPPPYIPAAPTFELHHRQVSSRSCSFSGSYNRGCRFSGNSRNLELSRNLAEVGGKVREKAQNQGKVGKFV